jgi:threonine dehydrogenase-like Zn-dependent dehydrogenase
LKRTSFYSPISSDWLAWRDTGFKPDEMVAVFGAGLIAAYSAELRDASKVFVADWVSERLAAAEKIGCVPINFGEGHAVDQIIEKIGEMVDRAADTVWVSGRG